MYEKSLNEVELILSTQKDSTMQVHKVWEEIVKRSKAREYEVASLPDFSTMLEGDRRFQIIPAQQKNKDEQDIMDESDYPDAELEELGFCSEDRVKLRSAKVNNPVIPEDEEEVGSIRRRAFVNQVSKMNKVVNKMKTKETLKKIHKKAKKKNKSSISSKKIKSTTKLKTKTRTKRSK